MIEIPESMWRHPDPKFARTSIHQSEDTNFYPMIDYLDNLIDINGDKGLLSLGWLGRLDNQDVIPGISVLAEGRKESIGDAISLGIPRQSSETLGLLISKRGAERFEAVPYLLNRIDERVPWKCDNEIAYPDFENPGLQYFYTDRCTHPDHYSGTIWRDRQFVNQWDPFNGNLIFDLETRSIWILSNKF